MFKPKTQQVETCLLKYSLEELENDLVNQRRALPFLEAETEQKCRETRTAVNATRSLLSEIERLNLENVRLTAKRMQLKRQSDDISSNLAKFLESQSELTKLFKNEEQETELQIRQYEDFLAEIAERYRKTRCFYNEEEINEETDKVNTIIVSLEEELQKRQLMVEDLKQQLDMIQPAVHEDILAKIGKTDLDAKIKELTDNYEALLQKRNLILNKSENVTSFMRFKNYFKDIIKNL